MQRGVETNLFGSQADSVKHRLELHERQQALFKYAACFVARSARGQPLKLHRQLLQASAQRLHIFKSSLQPVNVQGPQNVSLEQACTASRLNSPIGLLTFLDSACPKIGAGEQAQEGPCQVARQMAARELSCLPFLGSGREQAGQRTGPSLTERFRTLAVTQGPLAARPAALTPGQQMPHITLHTVQVIVASAQVQQGGWQQRWC